MPKRTRHNAMMRLNHGPICFVDICNHINVIQSETGKYKIKNRLFYIFISVYDKNQFIVFSNI